MQWLQLFALSSISIAIDAFTTQCTSKSPFVWLLGMAHYIFSTYLWFGGLFGADPMSHFIWVLFVFIGWILFKWKCWWTVLYNRLCDLDDDTYHRDILYWISTIFPDAYKQVFYLVIVFFVLALDFSKI